MKRIISIILLIIGICSYAEETTITGAFGFKLGEKYRIKAETKQFYEVKKIKQPFRKFQKYDISTNEEQRIYMIRAEYESKNIEEAQKEIKIIENILKKKYNLPFEDVKAKNEQIYFKRITDKEKNAICIIRDGLTVRLIYRKASVQKTSDQQEEDINKEVSRSNTDAL